MASTTFTMERSPHNAYKNKEGTPPMTTPTKALNLGCGKVLKMPGDDGFDEWVNSDLRDLQGVNRRFNAFVFPWPCEDEEFNHLYISHLVEHIPHTIREYKEWSINKDK